MLEVVDLRKAYGATVAIADVSLRLEPGEVFGLLGPNGAGKSTLVSLAVGLLEPDAGTVTIGDRGRPTDPRARRSIGIAPQSLALYDQLSAAENLDFFAAMQGLDAATRRERVAEALAFVGLSERAHQRVKVFSGGMARRLNLAAALVHHPSLLLLDEPTVGVDPHSRNALLDNIGALRERGTTILYTTHAMDDAARLCDRIGILDHGRLLAVGDLPGLLARGGPARLSVEFDDGVVEERTAAPWPVLERIVAERGRPPLRFSVDEPTLEQVFLQLTGRTLRDD